MLKLLLTQEWEWHCRIPGKSSPERPCCSKEREEPGARLGPLEPSRKVCKYSLRHRKCFVRGFIHELFVSKPERARYERVRAFDTNNEWIKPRTKHFLCRELFITQNRRIFIELAFWTQIGNKNSLTTEPNANLILFSNKVRFARFARAARVGRNAWQA